MPYKVTFDYKSAGNLVVYGSINEEEPSKLLHDKTKQGRPLHLTLSEKYEKIGDSLVFTVPYVYLTIISDKGVTASLTSSFGIQMINFNLEDEGYVPNTIGINSKIR